MAWDLRINGGMVFDGSGRPAYRADIAIREGRIVAMGRLQGAARHTIDADGAVVTPGFIDIHSHYDGQATWDRNLAPSSNHGVTTTAMGSCGVGFAPVRPTDHDRLIALMEGVEDIPGAALAEGLPWGWESFSEYMDVVDQLPHTMDLCAHVPHDALRVYVMGERAVADQPATDADRAEMARLLDAALTAGAVGFSTGRSDNHRNNDGQPTPASEANEAELTTLAAVVGQHTHGVIQGVSDFNIADGPEPFDREFDVYEAMARAAGGHPMSVSLIQRVRDPGQWERVVERIEQAHAAGLPMRMQVAPRPIGVLLGLSATFHPFIGHPTYKKVAHLPLSEQVAHLRRPEVRAQLLQERPDKLAGDGSSVPPLVDALLERIHEAAFLMFPLVDPPVYEPSANDSLAMRAMMSGSGALAALLDALLEDDGEALIYFALFNYMGMNLDVVRQMLTHPLALSGLSDGGAHVGTVCDASFPTTLLSWWGRDRPQGRLPLPWLVRKLTAEPARFLGLHDRGRLAPGLRADLNVLDFDQLRLKRPTLHSDLPAGGKRFLQAADGYLATVVRGSVTLRDNQLTGSCPGRVVRSFGAPRPTLSVP
ncbi:MAG: amidohydrolase [Deltaproteobacteria bacterium]|nr:amidohydrolase [Deltaproteobacteria bacterium]HCH62134.1 amidohydrolase [Deltaproteobacteria bacterium]